MLSVFDEIIDRDYTDSIKYTLSSGESGVIGLPVK